MAAQRKWEEMPGIAKAKFRAEGQRSSLARRSKDRQWIRKAENRRAKAKFGMELQRIRRAKKSLGVDKRRFAEAKQRARAQGI